jgi:uncharacterized repeat protein (TIGR03833 family)
VTDNPNFSKTNTMEGTRRDDVRPGISVMVELIEDKRTGKLTGGTVKEVLTTAPIHPHGIKVVLENGMIGRIKRIM